MLKIEVFMLGLACSLGTTLLLCSLSLSAAVLQVIITGIETTTGGHIMVGVYESEADFLKNNGRIAEASLAAAGAPDNRLVVTFDKLTTNKKYAVAVYHDVNDNNKLDRNFFGYGFTNNARGHLGPPNFDDAAILLDKENQSTSLYLSY
jgi:uncharacterized protein (DUF2141 family)